MIVDGTAIATEALARTGARAEKLPRAPYVVAIAANESAATRSYLAVKERRAAEAGCALEVRRFPAAVTEDELIAAVSETDADAVLVQLPLPEGIDTQRVCDAIPLEKDADVLSRAARASFERGDEDALLPPVIAAIAEVLERYGIDARGKRAVVVGQGFLVGAPAAHWLERVGTEVTRVTIDTPKEDASAALRAADIVVSGAGSPHLITGDLLKEGVVLIDAGTSELGGRAVGDADPACAERCALFTPVPGGIGPIAVAKLFENAVFLAERKVSFS